MATPAEIFAQAVDDIFTAIVGEVETVTYNGTDILADISYGAQTDEPGAVEESATITIKSVDVPAPAHRDTVIIGSTTWRVAEDGHKGDGVSWELPLYCKERPRYR